MAETIGSKLNISREQVFDALGDVRSAGDLLMIFWSPILRASTLFEGLLFVCRRSISARCICLASPGASQRFRWAE